MRVVSVPRHDTAARALATTRRAWLLAALAPAGCRRAAPPAGSAVPAGASVLALGDSITAGVGAEPAQAYPAQLAALTGWNVVNAGASGDSAEQALQRLPALLEEHRPALVIVSAGGNDFLRRVDAGVTERALRETVARARAAGAQVLLVAVPQPSLGGALVGLSDHPLYARLADELKLPLHAGGWARVLGDDKLKSDAIHANAAGYRVFAEGLAQTLRASGLLAPR